jgi:hypothetical protein
MSRTLFVMDSLDPFEHMWQNGVIITRFAISCKDPFQ